MGRYDNIKKTRNSKNKEVVASVTLPTIEPNDTDVYIISKEGDRMDIMAYQNYGDASLWWIIALVNKLGQGTLNIPPGTYIRIPQDIGSIITAYNNSNK